MPKETRNEQTIAGTNQNRTEWRDKAKDVQALVHYKMIWLICRGINSISNSKLRPCNFELVGCGEAVRLASRNATHFGRDIRVAHSNF